METLDVSNIRPLTDFRNKTKEYIKELNENKKPIVLTQHGKSAAVLLPAEKFQEMQEQIEFMRKVEDYKNNRVHPFENTFDAVDKIIEAVEKE
ncbi:type II toxin-antitoxin system Phd/YefM family antitoxin [candidate division KSB1 bacterium]|nr:type II toxin-antitoxin system Phd/YefM family antitoxin [candidate division KSB1 bacterium]NIR71384.1 type II toxin-antitoxin system Phd/YefM family antitoxin [candidate division KSB1 bacterium]NIS26278.1 type II toxin-antitoxin system Phd/YefM family antitoxin [candidate division KSB1 bacterium]NIT73040.1 type II toxin-antitoxin system Phd/YefM family antitoxin [candidate division KSB1 bacterium]NIU26948.1 type II toxin-antitoxin system Phd/YefM family antitoxin [candidate division KSB1 ba